MNKTTPKVAAQAGQAQRASHPESRPVDRFNGVKVFTATMAMRRERLGDDATEWLANNLSVTVVDIIVSQSSDAGFHCLTITVFYWDAAATAGR
jgi:hypothetical protein